MLLNGRDAREIGNEFCQPSFQVTSLFLTCRVGASFAAAHHSAVLGPPGKSFSCILWSESATVAKSRLLDLTKPGIKNPKKGGNNSCNKKCTYMIMGKLLYQKDMYKAYILGSYCNVHTIRLQVMHTIRLQVMSSFDIRRRTKIS